jgi:hypothetical protein
MPKNHPLTKPMSATPARPQVPAPQPAGNYIDGRLPPSAGNEYHAQPHQRPETKALFLSDLEPTTSIQPTASAKTTSVRPVVYDRQIRTPHQPPLLESDVPIEEIERRLQAARHRQ